MPIFTLAATAIVAELAITTFTVAQIAGGLALVPTVALAFYAPAVFNVELKA